MFKKSLLLYLALALCFCAYAPVVRAEAVQIDAEEPISAVVPIQWQMNIEIFEGVLSDADDKLASELIPAIGGIAFGDLADSGSDTWASDKKFFALVKAKSGADSYDLEVANAEWFDGGLGTNINYSCVIQPAMVESDEFDGVAQGADINLGVLGSAKCVPATPFSVYSSALGSQNRIIRTNYTMPVTSGVASFTPIPQDQVADVYDTISIYSLIPTTI